MQDLCVTATRNHNVYASFRPSIATKDAETRSKMNTVAQCKNRWVTRHSIRFQKSLLIRKDYASSLKLKCYFGYHVLLSIKTVPHWIKYVSHQFNTLTVFNSVLFRHHIVKLKIWK